MLPTAPETLSVARGRVGGINSSESKVIADTASVSTRDGSASMTARTNTTASPAGNESSENIRVLVRMRPALSSELNDQVAVTIQDSTTLSVINADNTKTFQCSYDYVLGPGSTQDQVYEIIRECTHSVVNGVNATVFAYGQTGSGKTHSMYGPPDLTLQQKHRTGNDNETGVIPRAIKEIFELGLGPSIISFSVYCSVVQIYNENIYDMLRDSSMSNPLSIREDGKEVYVQGLSEYQVKGEVEMLNLLRLSEENRAVRETHMNLHSSRSHSLFQILIEQKKLAADGGEVELRSKFNLVDLAGSEKWNMKALLRDDHISELTNINLSLHTLGRCIAALAARDKLPVGRRNDAHVPYRDSKLTRLLQDSLGGNSKTLLIATVSPIRANAEETISTLKFADRAKQVMIQARVNEIRPVDHALVLRLQREVEYLRDMLRKYVDPAILDGSPLSIVDGPSDPSLEVNSTRSQNHDVQEAMTSDRLRMKTLKAENDAMRQELSQLKQQLQLLVSTDAEKITSKGSRKPSIDYSSSFLKRDEGTSAAEDDDRDSVFIRGLKEAWVGQTNRFWDHFDQIEKIVNKFFRFELEEEELKSQLSQVMSSTRQLRHELMVPEALLKRLLQNYQAQLQTSLPETAKNASVTSEQKPSRVLASSALLPSVAPTVKPSPTQAIFQRQIEYLHQLRGLSGAQTNSVPTENIDALTAKKFTGKLSVLSSSTSAPSSAPNSNQPHHNSNAAPSQQPTAQPANLHNSILHVPFRVRGPASKEAPSPLDLRTSNSLSTGGWKSQLNSAEMTDEEAKLEKELRRAERKLKQQQQKQEIARHKFEKQQSAQRAEEEEKQAIADAEMARELKRQQRADKLKRQLQEYESRVKTEVEQMEALRRLGIDPASIM